MNLHWPRAGVKGMLNVGETQVVCVLNKIHPEVAPYADGVLEVEKLDIELSWKLDQLKMKQIANSAAQVLPSGGANQQKSGGAVHFDDTINTVPDTTTTGNDASSGLYPDYFGAEEELGGQKQCAICTVNNDASATSCYLCNSAF